MPTPTNAAAASPDNAATMSRQDTNSPTASSTGKDSSKPSYAGDFWNIFFNGRSAIIDVLRKDPKLRAHIPAYILGRMNEGAPDYITQWVNENVKHIHYFSYRNRLPKPLSNGLDHDAGWGCMVRTGQMMLCEALRRALPDAAARHTQQLFQDVPTAPFGLHAFVEQGVKSHIPVGNWFSPTALAFTVKRLIAESPITSPYLGVVIGADGAVRREEVSDEFIEARPVLVLIPIMAGREKVPADTARALLKMFQLPCTLGIVGGRPKHSLYFVGAQNDNVFFLDPHTVQPAFTSPETVGNSAGVRGTMNVAEMDPSMLLCFYLARNRDLEEWERAFKEIINPMTEYPLFSIMRRKVKPTVGGKTSPAHAANNNAANTSPAAAAIAPAAAVGSSSGAAGAGYATKSATMPTAVTSPDSKPQSVSPPTPPADVIDDCCYDSEVEEEMKSASVVSGPKPASPPPPIAE
jgi:cysteine protease ATG4